MKILKAYRYLYELHEAILKGERLPADEINLVGGRKSGKSVSVEIEIILIALLPIRVGLICFRAASTSALEYFDELKNTCEMLDIKYKAVKSTKTIHIGINKIRVVGINSNQKGNIAKNSGLTRVGGVDYIIRVFEEIYEFNSTDVLSIKEAVRGMANNVNILDIQICNPWAKSSWYVKYCAKYQNWDVNLLKTVGSQFGIYNIPFEYKGQTYNKRTVFHYTNWRVSESVLGQSDIVGILDTWNIDKKRATTTDWGLPGYESGSIYTHLLDKIGKAVYQEYEYILGGMNFGWGTNKVSSKTVAHFAGASIDSGIDVYGEYVSDNKVKVKDNHILAQEIVKFFYDQMAEYCARVGYNAPIPMRVRVDYMNTGIISLLNQVAVQKGIRWLTFMKCNKAYTTPDRIEIVKTAMGRQLIRFSDNIKELRANLEFAHYEDTELLKRVKANDDGLNSFEYAIEPIMTKLVKRHSNLDLQKLKRRF